MKGKYLYGIIKKPKDTASNAAGASVVGVYPERSERVDFDNLSALITDAEFEDYSLLAKEEVVRKLTSHQLQMEKIMLNFGTILPVKFGTILKNEEEVKSVLKKGYFFLSDTLQKMENKIELDLVCFWNEIKAAQLAYQENKTIRDCYKKMALANESGSDASKIILGKLVAQYLASKKKKISNQVLKVLKKYTLESQPHVLADINMIFNHSLLIEKENEEKLYQALNSLDKKFNSLTNFRLIGPLPPYSFATLVVESLDEEKVESAKKVLQLHGDLSQEKIKHSYNKLISWFHPDKGGDPLSFQFVTKNYQLLKKYFEQGLIGVSLYKWEEL